MKWIQTYSGQLINLDHVTAFEIDNSEDFGYIVTARGPSSRDVVADMTPDGMKMKKNDADEIMARIVRFILEVKRGYRNSFYSFPESDIARAKAEKMYKATDGGRPLPPSTLPEFSLRHVMSDAETPYHLYAGDELVEKLNIDFITD